MDNFLANQAIEKAGLYKDSQEAILVDLKKQAKEDYSLEHETNDNNIDSDIRDHDVLLFEDICDYLNEGHSFNIDLPKFKNIMLSSKEFSLDGKKVKPEIDSFSFSVNDWITKYNEYVTTLNNLKVEHKGYNGKVFNKKYNVSEDDGFVKYSGIPKYTEGDIVKVLSFTDKSINKEDSKRVKRINYNLKRMVAAML